MRTIETQVEILAKRDKVWRILIDFSRYKEWNSFILDIDGKIKDGEILTIRIRLLGIIKVSFKTKVIHAIENEELRWKGTLLCHGLLEGEHIFELKKIDNDKTLFIQREIYTGTLAPLFCPLMCNGNRKGFQKMNLLLKQIAETNKPDW
ncbi:MAG: SRPBCC domain-containing protein [Ignavibacteriae bacterium]|nr:SRPBCC domain-containing protein [Ignavibacteriota bacterium]